MGGMIDGFFLLLDIESSTLKISDYFDGTSWDGTQIFQRSSSPDPWKAMKVASQKAWMFGQELTDVFYNAGSSPFPFAPIPGGVVPYGIEAPFSAEEFNGQMTWLGRSKFGARVVVRATGYGSAEIISDEALNYQLANYKKVDDAEALVYQEMGVTFYCLTLPSENVTWCYHDGGGWHQRAFWNPTLPQFGTFWDPTRPHTAFWRARGYAFAFGKHLVGDRTSGTPIRDVERVSVRRRRGAHSSRAYRADTRARADPIHPRQLRALPPTRSRRRERTRQRSLGRAELLQGRREDVWSCASRSAGKIGEFKIRLEWNRLGQFRQFTPRIVVSDPIPWLIHGASVNVPRGA